MRPIAWIWMQISMGAIFLRFPFSPGEGKIAGHIPSRRWCVCLTVLRVSAIRVAATFRHPVVARLAALRHAGIVGIMPIDGPLGPFDQRCDNARFCSLHGGTND